MSGDGKLSLNGFSAGGGVSWILAKPVSLGYFPFLMNLELGGGVGFWSMNDYHVSPYISSKIDLGYSARRWALALRFAFRGMFVDKWKQFKITKTGTFTEDYLVKTVMLKDAFVPTYYVGLIFYFF